MNVAQQKEQEAFDRFVNNMTPENQKAWLEALKELTELENANLS